MNKIPKDSVFNRLITQEGLDTTFSRYGINAGDEVNREWRSERLVVDFNFGRGRDDYDNFTITIRPCWRCNGAFHHAVYRAKSNSDLTSLASNIKEKMKWADGVCKDRLQSRVEADKKKRLDGAEKIRLAIENGVSIHDDVSGIWIGYVSGRPWVEDGEMFFTDVRIAVTRLSIAQARAIAELLGYPE